MPGKTQNLPGFFMNENITQIDELIKAADAVKQTDFAKCLELGQQIFDLADEIDYAKGKADGLFYRGTANYYLADYEAALGDLQDALEIYKSGHNRQGEANCLMRIGAAYSFQLRYDLALEYLQPSLDIYESIGDERGRLSAMGNIAKVYCVKGHLDLALQYYLNVRQISEKLGDKRLEASSLLDIGIVYSSLNKFEQALNCFLKSLEINRHLNNKRLQIFILNNIGATYVDLHQPEKALSYLVQHQHLSDELGLEVNPYCLLNIGRAYLMQKNFDLALDYFKKSEAIFERMNHHDGLGLVHVLIGKTRFESGDVHQAIRHYESAIKWVADSPSKNILNSAHLDLANAYQQQENYQKAAEHFKKAYDVFQQRQDDEINKRVYQLKIKFEVERREKENELYRLKIERQTNELSNFVKNLASKNELIQKLQREALKLQHGGNVNADGALNILLDHLQNSVNVHEEWPIFQAEFDALFPDFRSVLVRKYPLLTRQEIRISELIRLDFSTKEIARILYIDPKSVEKHRNRIRKKMNLLHEISLSKYLSAL